MDNLDVARAIEPVTNMLYSFCSMEADPDGPWHRAKEGMSVLWTCFEEERLSDEQKGI